ncbi:hypothetical protein C1701_01105 [Actinoalloteichus sp. AHMU CJ021]|uniref:ArnT family glycosyltransferase n=1 Tax=Actinoalloteichus TaxID=65496 RepID=UPI00054E09B7|nr:glycosyltransferase family 39 protein [Actinoalloteichus caeruleus]AUS77193.1 hypothetical protein C1701_01105 [Actinoalloteichus sp. AHMU CJ021]
MIPSGSVVPSRTAPPPLFRLPVLLVSATLTILALTLAGRHGYYFDELYFRVAGNHLDWGYVDQPPMVPFLAWAQIQLFGDTVFALRVLPALIAGAVVLLGALIARELGGRDHAQLLAALATATSMVTISSSHILHTFTVDLLVWQVSIWCLLRLVRTRDTRLWLVVGLVAGVGMLAKFLPLLLFGGVLVGFLLVGPRQLLKGWHFPCAIGLGLLVAAPAFLWQAARGWPQLEMAATMSGDGALRLAFLPVLVVFVVGPLLAPFWLAAVVGLFRRAEWEQYRFLGVAFLSAGLLLVIVAGQPRYLSGLLTALLAVGAVPVAEWLSTRGRQVTVGVLLAGNAAFAVVLTMPVLPLDVYGKYPEFPAFGDAQLGQAGWPELAEHVADVYHSLPADERERAIVYAHNYSQAGALDRYGPEHGLPPVYSGHNSYADFGVPAEPASVALVFGVDPEVLHPLFASCETSGAFDIDLAVLDVGERILVCRDPVAPWSELWPELRWTGVF